MEKDNTTCQWGYGATGAFTHFWWKVQIGTTTLENCLTVSTRVKHIHMLCTYQKCRYMFFKNEHVYVQGYLQKHYT